MTEMKFSTSPDNSASMPEDVDKHVKVTFQNSLPMGERGTFTHDGDLWIAYRAQKNQRIWGLVDRLVSIHGAIRDDMVTWINARPGDADLVTRVLERVGRATTLHQELVNEKTEAHNS